MILLTLVLAQAPSPSPNQPAPPKAVAQTPPELPALDLQAAKVEADRLRAEDDLADAIRAGLDSIASCLVDRCPDEAAGGRSATRGSPADPFNQPYFGAVTAGTPDELSWYPFGSGDRTPARVWLLADSEDRERELPAPTDLDARGLYTLDPRGAVGALSPGVWTVYVRTMAGEVRSAPFFVDPGGVDPAGCCASRPAESRQLCMALGWLAQDRMWDFEHALQGAPANSETWMLLMRVRQWKNRLPMAPS